MSRIDAIFAHDHTQTGQIPGHTSAGKPPSKSGCRL